MYIVTRKAGQTLKIPQIDCEIEVSKIGENNVKLRINAPQSIAILRGEVPHESSMLISDELSLYRKQIVEIRDLLQTIQLSVSTLYRQMQLKRPTEEMFPIAERLNDVFRKCADVVTIRKIRVMLVEDDDNERTLMSSSLAMAGIGVLEFSSGRDALDYLLDEDCCEDIDFLITDLTMNGVNGYDLIKSAKRNPHCRHMQIVVVSGASPPSEQPTEVNLWLPKPTRSSDLIAGLDRLMQAAEKKLLLS